MGCNFIGNDIENASLCLLISLVLFVFCRVYLQKTNKKQKKSRRGLSIGWRELNNSE